MPETSRPPVPALRVYTTSVDASALQTQAMTSLALAVAALVDPNFKDSSAADQEPAMVWLKEGEGLAAVGLAARFDLPGAGSFAAGESVFDAVVAAASITDSVQVPGTGLVAFTSFPFDAASPAGAVITVPSVVVGLKNNRAWVTTALPDDASTSAAVALAFQRLIESDPSRVDSPRSIVPATSNQIIEAAPESDWRVVVRDALDAIDAGDASKIVVARGVDARADEPIDVAGVLSHLVVEYPQCWTFHIDNLIGATPELLLRRVGPVVESRVLAGTAMTGTARTGADMPGLSYELEHSDKDQSEHHYAVDSVINALAPFCSEVTAPQEPFVLALPNVMHLATDVHAVLKDEAFASDDPRVAGPGATLRMVDSLHPTAAVGGTPTAAAVEIIRNIEGLDRGRYAAPVGWLSSSGDGEFGIALRSAQLDPTDPRRVRLYAGCGIVAGSDPDSEFAESEAKLAPMRTALGISTHIAG